mmetsp:Transcript_16504/g.35975  ORF Transcript_16504/g.35975 Transcript_16504/m.35975 type:complete len:87 (+) Transcript_16504:278-538(+)
MGADLVVDYRSPFDRFLSKSMATSACLGIRRSFARMAPATTRNRSICSVHLINGTVSRHVTATMMKSWEMQYIPTPLGPVLLQSET